jgi:hypothetical protein
MDINSFMGTANAIPGVGGLTSALNAKMYDAIMGKEGERMNQMLNQAYPGSSLQQRMGASGASAMGGMHGAKLQANTAKDVASIQAGAQKDVARIQQGYDPDNPDGDTTPKTNADIRKIGSEIDNLSADTEKKWREEALTQLKSTGQALVNAHQSMENKIQAVREWAKFMVVSAEISVPVTRMLDNYLKGMETANPGKGNELYGNAWKKIAKDGWENVKAANNFPFQKAYELTKKLFQYTADNTSHLMGLDGEKRHRQPPKNVGDSL